MSTLATAERPLLVATPLSPRELIIQPAPRQRDLCVESTVLHTVQTVALSQQPSLLTIAIHRLLVVILAGAATLPHRDLSANDDLETRLDGLKRQLEKQQVLIEEQQELIHALREGVDKPVRGISGPAARLCALPLGDCAA